MCTFSWNREYSIELLQHKIFKSVEASPTKQLPSTYKVRENLNKYWKAIHRSRERDYKDYDTITYL